MLTKLACFSWQPGRTLESTDKINILRFQVLEHFSIDMEKFALISLINLKITSK